MIHALKSLFNRNSVHFKAGAVALVASGCLAGGVNASTLHYWSWEGEDGTPPQSGGIPGTGTWWQDKEGSGNMNWQTDGGVERLELPESGPGSAFPNPIPLTGETNTHGVDASEGYIRTSNLETFNRNSFTFETYFNAMSTAGFTRFFDISTSTVQSQGGVRDGMLAARVYNDDGSFNSEHTNISSSLAVEADKDYYVAIAISTGENAEDRFVDFYLQNLTDGGSLQHERVAIWDGFTSLYHRNGGISMRVGRDNNFQALGDIRYSDGVLDQSELMIIPEPGSVGLLLGGLALTLTGRRRGEIS
ncbi:PEP-CTERM sorting domain-containing protein [Phycisphaerales bacterium AB-hyl4]|uniref:PEP-CTERM sorting domain-containing protein n=1 Tax=Natronomicrosphaera hydrolytica TaxID=3242702 RepID=A0ABV4U8Y1_9BACT